MEIETKLTITELNISADEWELYDEDGREEAATRINTQIKSIVNTMGSGSDAFDAAYGVLRAESAFGACDSEGIWRLESLFKKLRSA